MADLSSAFGADKGVASLQNLNNFNTAQAFNNQLHPYLAALELIGKGDIERQRLLLERARLDLDNFKAMQQSALGLGELGVEYSKLGLQGSSDILSTLTQQGTNESTMINNSLNSLSGNAVGMFGAAGTTFSNLNKNMSEIIEAEIAAAAQAQAAAHGANATIQSSAIQAGAAVESAQTRASGEVGAAQAHASGQRGAAAEEAKSRENVEKIKAASLENLERSRREENEKQYQRDNSKTPNYDSLNLGKGLNNFLNEPPKTPAPK